MDYPYITMLKLYKHQIIMEGCCKFNNFKLIANWDFLFDDYIIDIKYSEKSSREKLYTFFDLYHSANIFPENRKYILLKIYAELSSKCYDE